MSFPDFNESRRFAEHLQPHEALLRAWLCSRVDVRAEIDDIVQEAFVRVLRARQQGELQSPKAFLFATARNLVLDALRHRRVARTEPLENDALDILDEAEAIPEAVARNQELALLTEAIQSLPDRCRQVFTLRKVYGLSQREIAAQLGVSEHTVSAQFSDNLDVVFTFAILDAEARSQANSAAPVIVNPVNNIAEHTFGLWTRYKFTEGPLDGFSVGVGLSYLDERAVTNNNNSTVYGWLDEFLLTDLVLSYERGNVRYGLNIDSLFGTDYEAAVRNQSIIVPGMGRNWKASVTWKF